MQPEEADAAGSKPEAKPEAKTMKTIDNQYQTAKIKMKPERPELL